MSKYDSICPCGEAKGKRAKKCGRCANLERSPKKNLPPDEQILLMLTKESALSVARKLGVGISTIRLIKLKYK